MCVLCMRALKLLAPLKAEVIVTAFKTEAVQARMKQPTKCTIVHRGIDPVGWGF